MFEPKIILGDSRKLAELVDQESADLVVTGPPYWNEVVYSEDVAQLSKIEDYEQFLNEIGKVWQSAARVMKPGAVLAFWAHDFYREQNGLKNYIAFHADLLKTIPEDLNLRNFLIWDRYLSRNKKQYPNEKALGTKMEYVLIFQKHGQHANQKKINEALLKNFWNPVWKKKTHPKLLGSGILFRIAFEAGKLFGGSVDALRTLLNKKAVQDKYSFKNYHTEDPEEIIERLIKDYSAPGDTVLDPFMGSGTVLKVARNLKRRSIGVDINSEALEAAKKKL